MQIEAKKPGNGLKRLSNVSNIIAIASGKGGVGKSTVTTNLAVCLANYGYKVGVLDADIYGPSQQMMLGDSTKPEIHIKTIQPLEAHGIKFISIANLIDKNSPAIWRGPMASGALTQLATQTNWGNLDFLLLDLPPGTGDIQLTMAQKIPMTGAVIVTTPQDIALSDANKAIRMFDKVHVSNLGVIENMSYYQCPNCKHEEYIFGENGGTKMANDNNLQLLGKIPLQSKIRVCADSGIPAVTQHQEVKTIYQNIVQKMLISFNTLTRDYSIGVDKITVTED